MEFGVPPVGAPDTAAAARPTGGVRRPQGAGPDFLVTLTRALEGPPAELRAEVEGAARRYEELRAMGRELRFEQSAETGRIVVEVRDLDGRLIRTVPPSAALEIAAGAPLP